MSYLWEIFLTVLGAIVSVIVGKLLDSFWARLPTRLCYGMRDGLTWLLRQTVQVPVIVAGLFGLLVTVIAQVVPFAWAASGNAANYPLPAMVLTFLIWQLIVFAMFRVSMKLVRFRFQKRREGIPGIGFRALPMTTYKPRFGV